MIGKHFQYSAGRLCVSKNFCSAATCLAEWKTTFLPSFTHGLAREINLELRPPPGRDKTVMGTRVSPRLIVCEQLGPERTPAPHEVDGAPARTSTSMTTRR